MPSQKQKSNTYLQYKQTETKGEILNNDAAIHQNLTHSPFVTALFDKQIACLGMALTSVVCFVIFRMKFKHFIELSNKWQARETHLETSPRRSEMLSMEILEQENKDT